MRIKLLHSTFAALVLVAAAALEDMLPQFFGVGFPLLLACALRAALKRSMAATVLFAVAAGSFEDVLSALPPFASASFFLLSALFCRRVPLPPGLLPLAAPAYYLWLSVWTDRLTGSVFLRTLAALPLGAVAFFAAFSVLSWLERKAALDAEA